MIRIHKDTATPEAIADILRLNIGDVLEQEKKVPNNTTLKTLFAINPSFKDWILSISELPNP